MHAPLFIYRTLCVDTLLYLSLVWSHCSDTVSLDLPVPCVSPVKGQPPFPIPSDFIKGLRAISILLLVTHLALKAVVESQSAGAIAPHRVFSPYEPPDLGAPALSFGTGTR